MNFIDKFNKEIKDIEGIASDVSPPRYWHDMGNHCLNKIMSGSFKRGIPQGRITAVCGPSGTGKSFLVGNIVKHAQAEGAFAFIIDSENALDETFLHALGVNTEENFMYKSVITIPHVIKLVSEFVQGYKQEFSSDLVNAPKVIIAIDSLDMLSVPSELAHFELGQQSSDQGLKAKSLKQALRQFVQAIKGLNISMLVTGQVYQATQQQILAGEGVWVINQAIRYALSQIILLTKLKLKDDTTKEVTGIRMKCEAFKSRFSALGGTCVLEIPYTTGMAATSGLLEAAIAMGIVEKKGSRYAITGHDNTWYSKDFDEYAEEVLEMCEKKASTLRVTQLLDEPTMEDVSTETKADTKARRKDRALA